MAHKGITLYSVGCEPAILRYKDLFSAFAYKTGGQYVPLRNANLLAKVSACLFTFAKRSILNFLIILF